ncbi:hypothetical protein F4780DRAFT_781614 [Xylariomycetidae sp. FL0641]|nr:hypothetical protein F4780DRAFT_781614 [Xylariomycetidae sp. FL0641]
MCQVLQEELQQKELQYSQLQAKVEGFEAEYHGMQLTIHDRENQIFSLQPYRREATSSEIGKQYQSILYGIQDWVDHQTDPLYEESMQPRQELMRRARRGDDGFTRFRTMLRSNSDLQNAARFDGTELDIIGAAILRFLTDKLFMSALCDNGARVTSVLKELELNYFAIRSWRAQSWFAWTQHPTYQAHRKQFAERLAWDLARGLEFLTFIPHQKPPGDFVGTILAEIIEPSLALQEMVQTTTWHHQWISSSPSQLAAKLRAPDAAVQTYLRTTENHDTLRGLKRFNPDTMKPKPSLEEVRQQLKAICSVRPALVAWEAKDEAIPAVVNTLVKEKVLVEWPLAEYDAFLDDPLHFRSHAQAQTAAEEARAAEADHAAEEVRKAEERFIESLLREEEAAKARQRARIRQEQEAKERAARKAEQERQEALRRAKMAEENAAGLVIKLLCRPCVKCRAPIEKNGGW